MEQRNWTSLKEYTDIKFDYFEGIAKITINRPEVYNAFRPQTNEEMLDAMRICRERSDIGVVVLTGTGNKAFCSGGDQKVKGLGGYIDQNGVPRQCARPAQGDTLSPQTGNCHGKRLRHRWRPCVAFGMRFDHCLGQCHLWANGSQGGEFRCRVRFFVSGPYRGAEEGAGDLVPVSPVFCR